MEVRTIEPGGGGTMVSSDSSSWEMDSSVVWANAVASTILRAETAVRWLVLSASKSGTTTSRKMVSEIRTSMSERPRRSGGEPGGQQYTADPFHPELQDRLVGP